MNNYTYTHNGGFENSSGEFLSHNCKIGIGRIRIKEMVVA